MNIFGNPNVHRLAKTVPTERETWIKVRPPQSTERAARNDSVNLSDEGRLMSAIYRRLDEIPAVRAEKVRALKEAIAAGTYHVPADDIAEAMLREGKLP